MTTFGDEAAYPQILKRNDDTGDFDTEGLSKREIFALAAFNALISRSPELIKDAPIEAVKLADRLIDALNLNPVPK